MTQRTIIDTALDAGASFDWITPLYGITRNAIGNGRTITLHGDIWDAVQWDMSQRGITYYAVQMQWLHDDHYFTFGVPADQVAAVDAIIATYTSQQERHTDGGRAWQWFKLLIALAVLGASCAVGLALAYLFKGGAL